MEDFYQDPPIVQKSFLKNQSFQILLKSMLANEKNLLKTFLKDLERWSDRVENEIDGLHKEALRNLPEHIPYSPFGKRIDQIKMPKEWKILQNISAEEALVAIAYERPFGAHSRLYQFSKLFLFHPSSAFFTCPLAMTDGAAKCLSLLSKDPVSKKAFKKMISKNPEEFTTCGQWMTEREGGSDVGRSSTEARLEGEQYHLYGSKWFASEVVSRFAVTLARTEKKEGSRSLSLFFVETRDEQGDYNQIQVRRLKDKLGTKVLPTAEVDLLGTPAILLGEKGQGVKNISSVLNITRLYNSICALGQVQRAYDLALDYAHKRESFGSPIKDHPLHKKTLNDIQNTLEGDLSMVLHTVSLLGREEAGEASKEESLLLRLFIPICKIVTGKHAVSLSSECLEAIGGVAYVEDTGLPLNLRDSQVFPIWEGTTNILSLDVLRVLNKNPEVLSVYKKDIEERLKPLEKTESVKKIDKNLNDLLQFLTSTKDPKCLEEQAREIVFSFAYIYMASLMLEHSQWADKNNEKWFVKQAHKFCSQNLCFVRN